MKNILLVVFLIWICRVHAQSRESEVISANAQIDEGVVKKDIKKLEKLYADDFVFTHGTGLVDSKSSWLKNIQSPDIRYVSRKQDSTKVEMHGEVAIVIGRLDIVREQKQEVFKYGIWYVRVFARRSGNWQLISHRTTKEWH